MKLIFEISGHPWAHVDCRTEDAEQATEGQRKLARFLADATQAAMKEHLAQADPAKRHHFWGQNNPPQFLTP